MIRGQSMARRAPAISPNGSAPRCKHLDELVPVTPQSNHCPDCRAHGEVWVSLVVCLRCGWAALSACQQ